MNRHPLPKAFFTILLLFPILLSGQIDLELNMTGAPLLPEAFKNFTFTITATNNGNSAATGIEVDVPLPPGFTYQGGNAYTASQGDYDIFVVRKWNVGTLEAGSSATFNLNLYSLQSTQLYAYAEVSAADQTDLDSSPANGGCPGPDPTSCNLIEDDEAIVILSNNGTCSLIASIVGTNCINPNNSSNPLDDKWSISIQVDPTNAPSGGWIAYSQGVEVGTGTYSQIENFGDFLITDGPVELTIYDQQNNGCFTTFTVSPPIPCSNSNCFLEVANSQPICSDSGTPSDPNDDGFQFFLFVNPTNPIGDKYQARISNTNSLDVLEVDYGQELLISKFIADGVVTIEVSDLSDPNCTTTITVNPTAPCSATGGSGIDMELVLDAANTSPAIYTTSSFTLNLSNTGTTEATGIEVEFPADPNMAYVSHNAQRGIYSNWSGLWNVGSLAPGETVSLSLDLFALSSDVIKLYAQVTAHNETDEDSSPGNGVCCVSNEDDETVIELNTGSTPDCNLAAIVPTIICNNNDTPNNPDDDVFIFSITPGGSNLGSSFAISGGGISVNGLPYGEEYISPFLPIGGGSFILNILDASGNCTQEVSIIPPDPCSISGPTGTDLEIDITSSQSMLEEWEFLSMTVTLNNVGNALAKDVRVSFPLPEGVVFTGGDVYSASQGTYEDYFEIWEVGDLAAGATAVIEFNLFSRQESNPVLGYCQVLSMDGSDIDSTPGNGTCCTANEDDEAVVTIAPLSNNPNNRIAENDISNRTNLKMVYPNPTISELNIVLESPLEQEAFIEIYNLQGQLKMVEKSQLNPGVNFQTIFLQGLPSGVYYLHLPGNNRPLGPNRFVIQR